MRGVCAWCGKDLAGRGESHLAAITHGICEECYLDLRVRETVKRLHDGPGPFHVFVPPQRQDILERLRNEAPPGCLLIFHEDRRVGDRRTARRPVPADRRRTERRAPNLSLVALSPPSG